MVPFFPRTRCRSRYRRPAAPRIPYANVFDLVRPTSARKHRSAGTERGCYLNLHSMEADPPSSERTPHAANRPPIYHDPIGPSGRIGSKNASAIVDMFDRRKAKLLPPWLGPTVVSSPALPKRSSNAGHERRHDKRWLSLFECSRAGVASLTAIVRNQ